MTGVRGLSLVSAALVAACIGGTVAEAQQNTLRFNHVLGPSEPHRQLHARPWARPCMPSARS